MKIKTKITIITTLFLVGLGLESKDLFRLCKIEPKGNEIELVPITIPMEKRSCERLKHNDQRLICVQEIEKLEIKEVKFDGKGWVEK